MEKLELKHLAPYLPYGIKVIMNDGLTYWMNDKGGIIRGEDYLHSVSIEDCSRLPCKPILRPLSDLNEEVDIHSEKITPIKVLGTRFSTISCMIYKNTVQLDVKDFESINLLHYMVVFEKLYKMHFDVFGLIDKGLAIDINTLNNQNS